MGLVGDKIKRFERIGLKSLLAISIIVAALWLGYFARQNEFIQDLVSRYGYFGVFLSSVFSGFNLIVPIPVTAFIPLFLASGLNQWTAIFVIVAGITLADSITYFIGRLGRRLVSPRPGNMMNRLEKLRDRYFWAPLLLLFFYAALIPYPNEILVIPLGFLGYRLGYILFPLLLGNALFVAFSAFGFINLLKILP